MIRSITENIFRYRAGIVATLSLITLVLLYFSFLVHVDAGFSKQLPTNHPFIETFREHRAEFGGANRILVSLSAKEGDIFTPDFFSQLKEITEEAYFIDGVNRSTIQSIFTPNVRFIEIVDGGFAGGNVVPADFNGSQAAIDQVRQNILKSSIIGRLVANDFTAALVSLQLNEIDPASGERIDPLAVAAALEESIRVKYQHPNFEIQIIGFAKAVGDIADGARGVLMFLAITVALVAFLKNLFIRSFKLTGLAITCSYIAVIWNLGLITLFGYGFDPLSILVPFLVFAIGISHSLQILYRVNRLMVHGYSTHDAAKEAFSALVKPGLVALASDTLGFFTIYLIQVPIIQELAVMASLGVLVLIFTNLLLLPLLVSYLDLGELHVERVRAYQLAVRPLWNFISSFTQAKVAYSILAFSVLLFFGALYISKDLKIGDLHPGVPELKADSRYNRDSAFIVDKYSIGVDQLNAIIETKESGCIDYDVVKTIDDFQWHVANNPNVHSTLSLTEVMKIVSAGWNEGHPKWRELSRNQQVLVQAVSSVETSTGLLNSGCSVMPVLAFLKDHKAVSLKSVIQTMEEFSHSNVDVKIRLATGNAGVMAAINDTVEAAQYPILGWIYAAITFLCLLLFRCIRATLCVIIPLMLVSTIAYALMAVLEIGLKTSSLPIAALGVGVGVDYGIYIFSQLGRALKNGETLQEAYLRTLKMNGSAVLVTGLTLSLAVSTWIFSDLKFQADMGILFSAMLLLNMLGALFILPALAYVFYPKNR